MELNILNNFIAFEGLDGAGTTTQSKLLADKLDKSVLTFEPTDSHIGKLIRSALRKELKFNQLTLAYLFAADRSNHIYGNNGIVDSINNGKIVVCDRYLFSSLAYQSLDLDFKTVFDLNTGFPMPEFTFFLDTDIDECFKRIDKRGENKEMFEKKNLLVKVYENYMQSFNKYEKLGYKIININGNQSINDIHKEIAGYLNRLSIS